MVKQFFLPPSCTFDVMTYVTRPRQNDVTYVKMCLPFLVTDTMRRFLRLESSKMLHRNKARGIHPLGVRGLKATCIYCNSLAQRSAAQRMRERTFTAFPSKTQLATAWTVQTYCNATTSQNTVLRLQLKLYWCKVMS